MLAEPLMVKPIALTGLVTAGDGPWAKAYPIIPHPGEVVVGLIAFIILYIVMLKVAVPKFEALYEERAAAIEGGMREAEEAQAEADALLAEYKSQLTEAREEAGRIREQARADAAVIAGQVREQANSDAERIIATAHRQVEAERSQATNQLHGELGRLATDLASRIVGESLQDQGLQERVIDRFLAELEQADPADVHSNTSQGV